MVPADAPKSCGCGLGLALGGQEILDRCRNDPLPVGVDRTTRNHQHDPVGSAARGRSPRQFAKREPLALTLLGGHRAGPHFADDVAAFEVHVLPLGVAGIHLTWSANELAPELLLLQAVPDILWLLTRTVERAGGMPLFRERRVVGGALREVDLDPPRLRVQS